MPFNGSGAFAPPGADYPAVANTLIESTKRNNIDSDFSTGLSTCITKDGQTTVTANIPFAGYRLTGVGAATARTDAAQYAQVQNSAPLLIGTIAGTNTITGVMTPTLTAYTSGQQFCFIPANTNTAATTINIDSLGAKNVFCEGAACAGGELRVSVPVIVEYDGTQFNIIGPTLTIPGTWTPVLTFATPGNVSVTYGTQVGGYIRRGKEITFNFDVRTSAFTHTTASGNLQLTGLPFTSAGLNQEWHGSTIWTGITKANYTQINPRITEGVTLIIFGASGSGQTIANVTAADMPTGGTVQLIGSVTCRIA
jgi:hypothetical protein